MAEEKDSAPLKEFDLISYSGAVNRRGYDALCKELPKQKCANALLVLTTLGGDAHAGFRIARALQHHYETFHALIPWVCKSAGTLICVGASHLYLDNQSELGPLDVQVKKEDEVVGRSSGLDILQAVNYLQNQAMGAFKTYLDELTSQTGSGLSTKVASEIATKLTTGLFSPIFAQVDPMRLAEMQRATDIAFAYGGRLNERSENLKPGGIERLVIGYPSHGFVIDRKEAATVFNNVSKPDGLFSGLSKVLYELALPHFAAETPKVVFMPHFSDPGDPNENVPDPNERPPGDAPGDQDGGPGAAPDNPIDAHPAVGAAANGD